MKVDLNTLSQPLSALERQPGAPASSAGAAAQGASEDRVTLSSTLAGVESLTAQAMQTPKVRQDKVAALQLAVRNGSYELDPVQIAAAVIQHEGGQG